MMMMDSRADDVRPMDGVGTHDMRPYSGAMLDMMDPSTDAMMNGRSLRGTGRYQYRGNKGRSGGDADT